MEPVDILVVGGLYPKELEEEVIQKSSATIGFAASAHLSQILKGFDLALGRPVPFLNILPVGSYPKRYRDFIIRDFPFSHSNGAKDWNMGYCNLTVVKKLSKYLRLKKQLRLWLKHGGSQKAVIFYDAENTYLSCVKWLKKKGIRVCLILPDLPAFLNLDKKIGPIYRMYIAQHNKKLDDALVYIDRFVLLTDAMADYLSLDKGRYVLMEGIADLDDNYRPAPLPPSDLKTIVYTGGLAKKFGIPELLEAFSKIPNPDYRLVICGSGEMAEEIREAAKKDGRILLKGALPHQEAVALQRTATVLVNPRMPKEDFTKYSFPSKTIEYMMAARPVLMFRLPGVPEEYDPYLNYFSSQLSMPDDIIRLCAKKEAELAAIGRQARQFVLEQKNCKVQAERILRCMEL